MADVEEFLAKNTKASCMWRRNNGNTQNEYRFFVDFRRVEIRNSTIAKIPSKMFANFTKVNIFRARGVKIQELLANDFESADNLMLLDLSHNEIKKLENFLFANLKEIKEIDLSFNQIESIDDGAFDRMGYNLTRLDLSENKLKSFKEDFLLNMIVNVTRIWLPFDLNLRNNEIDNIEPSQKEAIILPEVNLELSGNRMTELKLVKIEIFEIRLNNHSLTSVDCNATLINLDDNKLTKLRIKGKTLILSAKNNQLSELTFDDHLSFLKSLVISGNNLSSDTVYNFLQKTINIETLDISNNPLNSLKIDTFSELVRLERLSLSGVGITEITYGLFAYQRNMKFLDLSYNNLTDIEFQVFSSMPLLMVLNLSGTNKTTVAFCRRIKDVLPRLSLLGLENNNWKCNSLSRFKICLNSQGIKIMEPVKAVKNESNIVGIRCVNQATTEEPIITKPSTANPVHEKLIEMDGKVSKISENSNKGITTLELVLSMSIAIASTILIIYLVIKVKDYYRCNRVRMPLFSGRSSPDTIVSYDNNSLSHR